MNIGQMQLHHYFTMSWEKMLTDYVNHEGAKIMGYTDLTDTKLLKNCTNHGFTSIVGC